MFHPRQIQVILVLTVVAECVVCLTNKLISFDHQQAAQIDTIDETRFWESRPQFSPNTDTLDDRLDYLISGNNQTARGSRIKAANNQQHADNFQRMPPFLSQIPEVSEQTDSSPRSSKGPVEAIDRHRLRPDRNQPQTLAEGAENRQPTLFDLRSQQTGQIRESHGKNTTQPINFESAPGPTSDERSLSRSTTAHGASSYPTQYDQPTQTPTRGAFLSDPRKSSQAQNALVARPETQPKPPINVSDNGKIVTDHNLESAVLDHGRSSPNIADQYYNRDAPPQQRELDPSPASSGASSSIEFNNQVIYEGPVTPPPSTADNYYPTSSEKLPSNNNDHHNEQDNSNSWWAIGVGDEYERVNNLTQDNYRDYCTRTPFLNSSKQRSLCRLHPRVMAIVARGIRMAIEECQRRFAHSRWNCSIISAGQNKYLDFDASYRNYGQDNDPDLVQGAAQIFGDVMRYPNRERSFLNALSAAALAHAMTKACRQGELPDECGCDRKIRSNHRGHIEWVGCSDDIDYGAKFSRDFTDNFNRNEPDAAKTIYLHNSEVGRRVFKTITDITCNCLNGGDGLCATKRCWRQIGAFTDVVDQLMDRYESATHVQRSNRDPQKLRPVRRGVRRPKRKDLVYSAESPNYCHRDSRIGVLGTENRICNSTSQGPDGCSHLCCGRGFERIVERVEEDCNCKFVWCCHVKCDRCNRYITSERCN